MRGEQGKGLLRHREQYMECLEICKNRAVVLVLDCTSEPLEIFKKTPAVRPHSNENRCSSGRANTSAFYRIFLREAQRRTELSGEI